MIGILVPVLGRPQNVRPFLESALNTNSEYTVYFICSPQDYEEIDACRSSEAETMVVSWDPGPADFAKKINWAFDQTEEEWLFQGADDIRFTPKWDIRALAVAKKKGATVIGTNDLGNPQVRKGTHSTHTLFHRSYIDSWGGGTVDGSGKVFSELYDHQWTDTEFINTAIQRRCFAFAGDSIVEHLHPHWGKGLMDPTYEKATRETQGDMLLFKQRLRSIRSQAARERRGRRS